MNNRIITMESLVEFCKSQKTFSFNAKEAGHPFIVSTYGKAEYSPDEDNGLMRIYLKACHTGLNRNGSFISDEDMKRALPSFANKPVLAEITTNSKGEVDFGVHAITEVVDKDGNKKEHYIEQPVGLVPESCNAHLEYDEEEEKNFTYVNAFIYTFYGNETAEILERRNGVDVSVELEVNEFAWDAKNKWLRITDFYFNGVTLLGEDYAPGMKGARCELSDFSHYESQDYSKEINEMKSRLTILESRFSDKKSKEGGNVQVDKLNELLTQYNKTLEDLDFDYEGLSDEELEAKFAEKFADGDNDTPSNEDNEPDENESENDNNEKDESEEDNADKNEEEAAEPTKSEPKRGGTEDNNDSDNSERTIPSGQVDDDDEAGSNNKINGEFSLSLQEKVQALYELVCSTYEEADNEWYGVTCYENPNYVVMHGYFYGRHYRQDYKVENDSYSLVGDRVQVYEQYLTQEEMDALETMKADYQSLKEFKANIEKENYENAVNALIEDVRFDSIRDSEEFKAVVKDAEKYTLEELETKFKVIFADMEMNNMTFSQKEISKQKSGKMFSLPSRGTNPVSSKYGGIFSEQK